MEFKDKIVIVTGGASGIGEATVKAFCQEGAKVIIADLSDTGQTLSNTLNQQGYQSLFFKIDVTDRLQNQTLIDFTVKKFGGLDIIFANAGIATDHNRPAGELPFADWDRCIDINLNAVFTLDKLAIEYWIQQDQSGIIVNCGSIHSWVGKERITGYATTKGAVKLLTQ